MITSIKKSSAGFSLVELAIAVVIIGILTAVAYPMYQNHVIRSRRADAKSALAQLAQLQENYYVQANHKYATKFSDLSGGLNELKIDGDMIKSSEDYYRIILSNPNGDSTFTLTAVPNEEKWGEFRDSSCAELTINSVGEKSPDECW